MSRMVLVGYVSDERFVASADALLEFRRDGQTLAVVQAGDTRDPETPTR